MPPIWSPVVGAKREAGVSPAQSRCCKLKRVEAQYITSLCDAIAAWEDGAETSKPEDLPNRNLSVMLSRKGDPTIEICMVPFWCVLCFCAFFGVYHLILLYRYLEVVKPHLSTFKSIKHGKKVIDFILGADVSL